MTSVVPNRMKIRIDFSFAYIGLCILFVLQKTVLFETNQILFSATKILQWPLLLVIVFTCFDKRIKKSRLKYWIASCVILVLFFVSYVNSGLANIFKYGIIVLASHRLKDLIIFKKIRNTYAVLVSSIFVLGLLRIIPSVVVRRGYFTYGFVHSNVFAMFVFSIICSDIIYGFRKISWKKIAAYTLMLVFVTKITDCRSVLLSSFLLIILLLILRNNRIANIKSLRLLLVVSPIIFAVISFYFTYNFSFDSQFMNVANTLSSQRIYMAWNMTKYYGMKLLGQDCANMLVENSYITVFFAWGIIPGVITVLYYCFSIKKAFDVNNYALCAVLVSFAAQGLFEGSAIELFLNASLLATMMHYTKREQSINNSREMLYVPSNYEVR